MLSRYINTLMNKILRFFDLHQGEDRKEAVLENVVSNISFRGANAWILALQLWLHL
ncbi:Uncharacterised protein [Sphingobacterium multivorum]|uniref:Uncharacterized protein n=1 Tax=Sphingobacterium multivorum TaxID=28454 RepID=A0A653Y3K4_SPHMU|nr:Uncharacterised protein [Sphingobacterium multivorum]VXC37023.1 conserved hypothetical protein [Sphingobacterium multivorum]